MSTQNMVNETLVLGRVKKSLRARSSPQSEIVGARGPYLLPADEPAVAAAHRSGAQSSDVGPGARLGKELTPDLLALERGADEAALHRQAAGFARVGMHMPRPMPKYPCGAPQRLSSWEKMACWMAVPPPPHSTGQVMRA